MTHSNENIFLATKILYVELPLMRQYRIYAGVD